ncbi:MAG: protein-disulfide reductase DsbD N-terminal domain-containing protein [Acidobacteria bacterium]|nr:protein-disulfide reductase DsbD N-terminal domain-containing protein [Acidobacteriota bacterium]
MLKTKFIGTALAIIFTAFAAAAVNAQTVNVGGSIGNGTVARGGSARGVVVLNIPGGLHVNSSRPNSEYAIPTTVRLTATGGRVTAPVYPRGKNKSFQFSNGGTINIYEGRVSIPFTVRVPANFRGNTVTVRAAVRYQACTDDVCYPPRTQNITLTARVR